MIAFWRNSGEILDRIYIPKFYDPTIKSDLLSLAKTHTLLKIGEMINAGHLSVSTGNEIGKMAYGTGEIPFVRTSDISNWEIKSVPKQGVSERVFSEYSEKQDVRAGDILLVRDGTYLIGTNCFVSTVDKKLVYQSHILKFRLSGSSEINPHMLFLALNSDIVKRQIRSMQFTADTIDTIGDRYLDVTIAIPKLREQQKRLILGVKRALKARFMGKAFIKQAPILIEEALRFGKGGSLQSFLSADFSDVEEKLTQDTVTDEFGDFETFWLRSDSVQNRVVIPKYYNPRIARELEDLSCRCDCYQIGRLVDDGVLQISTGDEVGKMAYGTGDIPFLRTSDFSSWEIKHDPKQGVSEDIYRKYARKQDLQVNDILLVRDGTYLIGGSCIVTELDRKALYCGGLYRIRSTAQRKLDPFLLLGLLNSYIVKRQIRTKQFTRDVIDTIGKRLMEVVLPIPRSRRLCEEVSQAVKYVVQSRVLARQQISHLAKQMGGFDV